MRRSRFAVVAAAAVLAAALAGCAPQRAPIAAPTVPATTTPVVTPTPTVTPVVTPTPTPTPTSLPTPPVSALPANVLLRVTTNVTASNHAVITLTDTVYVPSTTVTAADAAAYQSQCAKWQPAVASPQYLTSDVVATLSPGSPAWPAAAAHLGSDLDSWGAWTGGWMGFEAVCSGAILKTIPGRMHGITEVPGASPADSTNNGWAHGQYGVAIFEDTDHLTPAQNVVFSGCTIQVSPTVTADAIAKAWVRYNHVDGCEIEEKS